MANSCRRYVILTGSNISKDMAVHVINEIGSNGEEVEILFTSEGAAKEYMEAYGIEGDIVEVIVYVDDVVYTYTPEE